MKAKYIVAAIAGALFTLTSCINDLETLPMNDWDTTSETAYGTNEQAYVQGLAKLYFNFTSNDTTDLLVSDGGASELIRCFWTCNEVSTDAAKCAWGDTWAMAINSNTWTDAENDMVYGVFVRTLQGIAYVNEYLRQTAPEKLSDRGVDAALATKIEGFRAEARFLRAYFYWMAMDIFGAVPFTTEDSPFGAEAPQQASSKQIFNYVVSELEALAADGSAMPVAQSNRPRADKGSVLGLLARVYLNAEVYAGEAKWTEAKSTCEKIFGLGYALCSNYEHLFRGDNGENADAYNEFLYAVSYDQDKAQSWGGGTYLTCAAIGGEDKEIATDEDWVKDGEVQKDDKGNPLKVKISRIGTGNGWNGLHIHEQFINKFYNPTDVDWANGTYTIADKRGANIFTTEKRTGGTFTKLTNTFYDGWGCYKYNNIPSTEDGREYWLRTRNPDKSTNIDFPMIRLAEIYLIYAEACLRLGSGAPAQQYMAQLAERAGVDYEFNKLGSWDNEARDWFVAERARELLWEGHRRTDLIRYGLFTSAEYLWPFKGGEEAVLGQAFADYKKLFAIPASQIKANPGLNNPVGY